jgi:hypothetical protein
MKKYILLLFFGVATIFYIQGAVVLYKAYGSTKWPSSQGVVISSTVSFHSGSAKRRSYYTPDVSYRYMAGSIWYVGDTICFASIATHNKTDMGQIAGRYPVGREVTVYYNPADPQESVLEPGATFDSWTKVLGASIFLLMGVGIKLFSKGRIKKNIAVKIKQ